MKKKLIITAAPLIFITLLSLTAWQGKGNKGQGGEGKDKGKTEQHGNGGSQGGNVDHKNGNADHGNGDKQNGNSGKDEHGANVKPHGNGNGQGNGNSSHDKDDHGKATGNKENANQGNGNNNSFNEGAGANGKEHGKRHREDINWAHNERIDWNLNNTNYANRNKQKKVTVCHNTGNGGYPVMINVSENALKAHLNHGDQVGNCNTNYQGWPANYIQSRETVYNQYETTWESMSYGEALVRLAMNKILGLKNNLTQVRSTLSPDEIRRREALINELQTNTNNLQNQVGATQQQLSLVSINVSL